MPSLDVFKADAFSMASLTTAINTLPYQPKYLGQSGLFTQKPLRTTTVMIEKRQGKLSVLPWAARGTMPTVDSQRERNARIFQVPHIPANCTVRADDVLNIRAFGSETELEAVSSLVNQHLGERRADHETTFEWHRVGAITGSVRDADGTELYNLFTEFDVTEQTVDFALGTAATEVKTKCTETIRLVEDALGEDMFTTPIVWCGNAWWDAFISHPSVKEAYVNWGAATMLQTQQRQGFTFCGLEFRNYRGDTGGTKWIADDIARVTPRGVMDLFEHHMAPGDMIDTVGTAGQMIYAKQEVLPFGKGIEIHTQSNPLILCTRPECLIKLTTSGP